MIRTALAVPHGPPAAWLAGLAALDGWAGRLMAGDGVGVSLFAVLALVAALSRPGATGTNVRPVVGLAVALLIVVPSGVAAWVALGLLSVSVAMPPVTRLMLAALAAAELVATAGFGQVAGQVLPAEAAMAAALLGRLGFEATAEGAVLAVAASVTVVAPGCSGLPGALYAALGAAGLTVTRGTTEPARIALAAGLAAPVAFAVNLVRLSVMALDPAWNALGHGAAGALMADAVTALGLVAAAEIAARPGAPR